MQMASRLDISRAFCRNSLAVCTGVRR